MAGFEMPRNLVWAAERQDAADAGRRGWMTRVPALVDELARRWSLTLGRPFQPGGYTSWAAPARDRVGRSVVLKVGWYHDEARDEVEGLRIWDGAGTVRLLEAATMDEMAGLLDLDPGRLRNWLFARCVQESIDNPQLVDVATELAP